MFGRNPTSVGRGSTLRGSLHCGSDDAKIAGEVHGEVVSEATVVIAQSGQVFGDVTAKVVVVEGQVEGTVTAHDQLQLQSTGVIVGDAIYGTLEVQKGGVVKGRTMTTTSRPPPGHPAVDDTLRLGLSEGERVTAEYPVAEIPEAPAVPTEEAEDEAEDDVVDGELVPETE